MNKYEQYIVTHQTAKKPLRYPLALKSNDFIALQKYLFGLGFSWYASGQRLVQYRISDDYVILVDPDGIITQASRDWVESKYPGIFITNWSSGVNT